VPENNKTTLYTIMKIQESHSELERYWWMLRQHWKPASCIFMLTVGLAILAAFVKQPTYRAEGTLLVKKASTSRPVTELGKEIGQITPLNDDKDPLLTEKEVILSVPITQEVISILHLKGNNGKLLERDKFLKNLEISQKSRSTDVLQISYRDANAKQAASVVNMLMRLYLTNMVNINRSETSLAWNFINQQVLPAEAELRKAETVLRQFRERHNIVELQEESKAAVAINTELQQKVVDNQAQLADLNSQSQTLQKQLGLTSLEALSVSTFSQAAAIQEPLRELRQLESQLALEKSQFQEQHPKIVDLKGKIQDVKLLLQQRTNQVIGSRKTTPNGSKADGALQRDLMTELVKLQARQQGLLNQTQSLSRAKSIHQQRTGLLPKLEQQQWELERHLKNAQNNYSSLVQKQQEIRVTEQQNIANARILSPALIPKLPVTPRKLIYLLSGVLLGILSSLGTVMVLNATDRSIRGVLGVRQKFDGWPILGIIPICKKPRSSLVEGDLEPWMPAMVSKDDINMPIYNAYRLLQLKLLNSRIADSEKKLMTFVVTSSVSQEGTSSVSANLAASFARSNRKVLLIDANFYDPCQDCIWNISNREGLSNLLLGQTQLKDSIQNVLSGLDILPSGVNVHGVSNLFESETTASFIQEITAQYDIVVIDAPPLSLTADALVLGKMVDGVIFVVRPGVADISNATSAKDTLEQLGLNVLGIVVNGASDQQETFRSNQSRIERNTEQVRLSDINSSIVEKIAPPEHCFSESVPHQKTSKTTEP
jgi:polysaccharide biosynthesis transport protein